MKYSNYSQTKTTHCILTYLVTILISASTCLAESSDQKADLAIERGLTWLKGMQKQNGSWSNENYPAITALGLWAFSRSNHPDREEVCNSAAKFVEQFAQSDGGIYKSAKAGRGSGGLSTYNTAICMTALHAYNKVKYTQIILNARKFLAGCQISNGASGVGGFGYNRPTGKNDRSNRADLSNTSWAIHAMRVTQDLEEFNTGKSVDIDWNAAIKFADKLQNTDNDDKEHYGGFGYESNAERGGTFIKKNDSTVQLKGYGSMTYAGLESMIYAQVDRKDPRIRSALQWAALHWSVDENPGMGIKGLFYYFNIMSKALSLSGKDTLHADGEPIVEWKKDLINKLTNIQDSDGCWKNSDNQFWEGDSVLVTSYAIIALQYTLNIK